VTEPDTRPSETEAVRSRLPLVASVSASALLLLLPWLGGPALFDRDETYYAEAAREMREAGNWFIPRLNGQAFHQKPFLPLAFICASYSVFGVNETAARMPSALFAFGTMMLTAAAARHLFGRATALRSSWILGSSLLFLLVSRSAMTDSAFLFFFTASLVAFIGTHSGVEPSRGSLLAMYGAMGLATLCKGPVGLLLPLVILLVTAWSRGGWALVRQLRPIAGTGLVCGMAVGAVLLQPAPERGGYIRDFLWRENIGRFLSPMEAHRAPFWIYLPVLLLAFLPWSPFVPGAWRAVRDRNARWLLGAWVAVPFLFFSAAATKLPHYLLPVFPALAILVGVGWERETNPRSHVLPLAVAFVASSAFPVALCLARARWPDLLPISLVWTAAAPPAGALVALFVANRPELRFALLAASMLIFIWMACGWSLPEMREVRVIRPVGLLLRSADPTPVFAYRFLEPGLLFYSQRTIERLETREEVSERARRGPFVIVVREDEAPAVRAAAGIPMKTLGGGRGFCEDSGPLRLLVLARGPS
jgi:4-amino-4-deoxy-L-arabinose transferase-like glycosyltransferase